MDAIERLRGVRKEEVCRLLITRTLEKSGEDRDHGDVERELETWDTAGICFLPSHRLEITRDYQILLEITRNYLEITRDY